MALASQGDALIDHIGPDAASAIDADLARRPGVYLDRFECLYVRPAPSRAYASLFLALPLWRLRVHDADRVRALAARMGHRYAELARLPVDPADPGFAHRLAEQARSMALVRDGVDLAPGATWKLVAPDTLSACVTSMPDTTTVIRVTRACSCGEPLACRATMASGVLRLDVRFDPAAPAVCRDCYPTSTSCTLPDLPARVTVRVEVGDALLTTWQTDDRGLPIATRCS